MRTTRIVIRSANQRPSPTFSTSRRFRADVRGGVWSELDEPEVGVDAYRRNLQRAYLDLVEGRLGGSSQANGDAGPFLRGELRALDASVVLALGRTSDRATRLHLEDVRHRIARTLDPSAGSAGAARALTAFADDAFGLVDEGFDAWSGLAGDFEQCWPDYAIRLER